MTFPATRQTTRRSAVFHALAVTEVEPLCADAAAITFLVPDDLAADYAFKPGQSLTLRRLVDGREQRRSYSICAPAGTAPRVGVRIVPDGLFSTWLVRELRAGDAVDVQTPSGSFVLDPSLGGRQVLIAAGSGITPMMSMASSLLTNPDAHVTLLYGNRRTNTVMFAEELADLKDTYGSRFELIHVLSREPREVELFSGRLDAPRIRRILQSLVPVDDIDGFWLCGPFEMIESAREMLTQLGVPPARVHAELFAHALSSEDARTLSDKVRSADLKQKKPTSGRRWPDELLYEVELDDGSAQTRVHFTDQTLPESVRTLIEWIDSRPESSHLPPE